MKWLLILGLIAIILNAPETSAKHSKEHKDPHGSHGPRGPHGPPGPHGSSHSKESIRYQESPPPRVIQEYVVRPADYRVQPIIVSPPETSRTVVVSQPQRRIGYSAVNVMRVSTYQINEQYFSRSCSVQVVRTNEMSNVVKYDLIVLRDLPTSTRVVIRTYGSLSRDSGYQAIGQTYSFGLTETTNRYYELMPQQLTVYIKRYNGLVQGRYQFEDSGCTKFYELLYGEQLNYPYYKVTYTYESAGIVLLDLDYRFQSLNYY